MKLTNHSIKLSIVILFAFVLAGVSGSLVPKVSATISTVFNLDELTDFPGLDLLRGPHGPQGEQGPTQILQTTKVKDTVILPGGPIGASGTASAECPEGTVLTGGSYEARPGVGISKDGPSEDNRSWEVSGVNNDFENDSYVTAVAECASLSSS